MTNNTCSLSKNGMLSNLQACLSSEKRAIELYQNLLDILTETMEIEKIKTIITDEKRHVALVENLIQVIQNYYTEA